MSFFYACLPNRFIAHPNPNRYFFKKLLLQKIVFTVEVNKNKALSVQQ